MKSNEIRKLTLEEIKNKIREYKSDLLNLRFQLSVNQLSNFMRIRKVKRNIARLLTIKGEFSVKS